MPEKAQRLRRGSMGSPGGAVRRSDARFIGKRLQGCNKSAFIAEMRESAQLLHIAPTGKAGTALIPFSNPAPSNIVRWKCQKGNTCWGGKAHAPIGHADNRHGTCCAEMFHPGPRRQWIFAGTLGNSLETDCSADEDFVVQVYLSPGTVGPYGLCGSFAPARGALGELAEWPGVELVMFSGSPHYSPGFRVRACAIGGALFLALSCPVAAENFLFVGVKKCKSCHKKDFYGDQISTWRRGPHAEAFESLASPMALEIAEMANLPAPPQESAECLQCHATKHGIQEDQFKYPLELADGIQCESCHGAGSDYRKKSVMSDREDAISNGMLEISGEVCTSCHNPDSPTWDDERFVHADGSTSGFAYDEALSQIAHPVPSENRGHVLEIEKALKDSRRARR